jgi:amidase
MPYRSSLCLMATMVRDGAVSPVELVESHLKQIAARNPALNAFTHLRADEAVEEARALTTREPLGLLHGVPLTIKDSFDVAGLPTRCGSRLRTASPAAGDAAAVARLRAAGAIILGKTNTPEMLLSYETDNLLTGRTNHPLDPERTPGGSSGGEGAAIAALCSPGGLGTDGGGSIRVPAHFCGIAGLKPTPGRIPASGHFPSLGYPGGLTTVAGPMARSAQDLRLLFSVLAGYEPQDPFSVPVPLSEQRASKVRVGVWEQFYNVPVEPEIRAAVRRTATTLHEHHFVVDEFSPQGLERIPNVWAFLFNQWPSIALRKLIEGREDDIHWTLRENLPADLPAADQVLIQLASHDRLRAALLRQMEPIDVLLMPVCGITAFPHRQREWQIDGQKLNLFKAMMPAVLANVLGLPAVTIPAGKTATGLPIGIQLLGRPFEDELLLDLAIRLEGS